MIQRPILSITLALIIPLQVAGPALAVAQDPPPNEESGGADEIVQETPPESIEEENEWEALDAEIRNIDLQQEVETSAPDLWGYARVNMFAEDDGDLAGVVLDTVRLNLTGQMMATNYRVTADFARGTALLQDAWMSTGLGGNVHVTFGQFKIPMLRSGLIEARDLLFITRTRNGVFYSRRDQGAMFNGDHGRFHWSAAIQNGADGIADSTLITAQTNVNVIGEPPLPWEGAYQAGSGTRLTLGAGVSDDNTGDNARAIALELYGLYRGVSLQAEWVDYGRDYTVLDPLEQRGSTSPLSVTASYMIVPDRYEFAVRYDDVDDADGPLSLDRRSVTVGLNRYIQGHEIKWQLNYVEAFKGGTQDGSNDSILALGLTASF